MKRIILVIVLLGVGFVLSPGFLTASQAGQGEPGVTGCSAPASSSQFLLCAVSGAMSRHQGGPQWYVTEGGYIAAVEEDLLDRAIFWAGLGNESEFMRFMGSTDLVFPLRSGLRVRLEKFSFSGKVRIRPEGSTISVWTVREAIRSELPRSGS